ncbi:MAG: DUF6714 family protein [Actinomycetota bacterium]
MGDDPGLTSDDAIAALEVAFADVQRPSDEELLHPRCFDDGDLVELYPYDDWRAVPDDVLERAYAALAFLSATGYRFFIPAYLRYVLRHPQSGAAVVDSTIWSLIPELYERELVAFSRSKYELLDDAQRRAIEIALEVLTPEEDLDAGWALASWRETIGWP